MEKREAIPTDDTGWSTDQPENRGEIVGNPEILEDGYFVREGRGRRRHDPLKPEDEVNTFG